MQHGSLGLCRCSPEHVDNGAVLGIHGLQDRVCELLPAVTPVGIGLVGADRQDSVQKEDSLSGPFDQISVVRHITAYIIMKLFVDIYKRRRCRTAGPHREAHAVGLSLAVIGILSQDHNTDTAERSLMEGIEKILSGRIYRIGPVFILYKGKKVSVIWF